MFLVSPPYTPGTLEKSWGSPDARLSNCSGKVKRVRGDLRGRGDCPGLPDKQVNPCTLNEA